MKQPGWANAQREIANAKNVEVLATPRLGPPALSSRAQHDQRGMAISTLAGCVPSQQPSQPPTHISAVSTSRTKRQRLNANRKMYLENGVVLLPFRPQAQSATPLYILCLA